MSSPCRGRCHICEAPILSPARLESLKIQLSVIVCPPPRAHLSVSEPSRPSPRGPAGQIRTPCHPCGGERILGVSSCLSSPALSRPPRRSLHSCQKAWGGCRCSYGRISKMSCHMHKARSRTSTERRPCLLLERGRHYEFA